MKKENYLKVGLIGLGKMGLLHSSILSTFPNVKLSAICERSPKIAWFAKKIFSTIPIVDSLEKLLDLKLDAVFVTTPIPSHFPILQTIYSKEIAHNLFIEKTLALNYDETIKLCHMAQSSGGVNMVGYMCRFAVTFRKAKELLDGETIGKLISFRAYAYSQDFVGVPRRSAAKGGVLRDLGAHVIDLASWYFGDLEVKSAKLKPPPQEGSEDMAQLTVKGLNELEGEFDISWCQEGYRTPEFGLTVTGSKGTIKVVNDSVKWEKPDGTSQVWHRQDLNDTTPFLLGAPEYFREDEHFIKSILEGRSAEPSFSTASKVDYLIDQVRIQSMG